MTEAPIAPFRIDPCGLAETPIFPDTPLERVREGARSLLKISEVARSLAEHGREIDLTGLDSHVGAVCAKALDLCPEEGRLASGELQALLAEIDRLSQAMRLTAGPP